MTVKIFGCHSIQKELYFLAALSPHDTEVEIISDGMSRSELQRRIDAVRADRILLALGERRTDGLHSTNTAIIAPRAHDCAHLLLGSAERYRRVFSENEDSPRWLNLGGCLYSSRQGPPCVLRSFFPGDGPMQLPEGTREYAADLSLLKALVNMTFDPSQAIVAAPGMRIILDPVEIISCEPA